jgi:murein DD-endopeptidase MepM/ murein hydrolase activator NlpD
VRTVILAGVLLVLIGAPAVLFLLSSPSAISIAPDLDVLGASSKIGVRVENPHGVRALRLRLEQGSALTTAAVQAPPERWLFWMRRQPPSTFEVQLRADPRQGFRSGPATLTVEAVANDFRARTDTLVRPVRIHLAPPKLSTSGEQHYINQGGAGLTVFTVSGYWTEAGVRIGKQEFRSYPVPGGEGEGRRFSLFVFPWDTPATEKPVVFARNPAGEEVTAGFPHKVFAKSWRRRELPLSEAFLEKIVPRLDPHGSGPLLERFLRINRDMRQANNRTLADLRLQTEPRFLWENPFEQLASTKVEALFADVRSYVYRGAKVDEQVHLGFDLSKTAQAPVAAANHGKVVFAGDLGIYGQCVVIDHGYALQSIYAHLSEISAAAGQAVRKGEIIGRSGDTGLAGGDHLHFSMQIDGVQTNPLEWWDPKWIGEKILARLPAR